MVEARAIEEPTSAAEQVGAAASVLDEPEQHMLTVARMTSALNPITPMADAWSDGAPGPESEEAEGGQQPAPAQQEQGDHPAPLPRPSGCAVGADGFADPLFDELPDAADLKSPLTEPARERPKPRSLVAALCAATSVVQAAAAEGRAAHRCFVHRLGWRELGVAPTLTAEGGPAALDFTVELPTWRLPAPDEEPTTADGPVGPPPPDGGLREPATVVGGAPAASMREVPAVLKEALVTALGPAGELA